MQNLFKAGLACLVIQVIAFVGVWLFVDLDSAFTLSMFVLFAYSILLLLTNSKQSLDQAIAADIAASNALGIMCAHAIYHLQEGGSFMWVMLGIAVVLTCLRGAYVGTLLSTKVRPPERFMDAFLGALPLGIGVVASFAVMWDRAGKPKE